MKTPYDPAIRIGKRKVERLRLSLHAELTRIITLDEEQIAPIFTPAPARRLLPIGRSRTLLQIYRICIPTYWMF